MGYVIISGNGGVKLVKGEKSVVILTYPKLIPSIEKFNTGMWANLNGMATM